MGGDVMGRGSRFHRALNPRRWDAARRAAIERAGHRCEGCSLARRLEVHHVRELRHGGAPYDVQNLRALCVSCHHIEHGSKRPSEGQLRWRRFAEELRAELRDTIANEREGSNA